MSSYNAFFSYADEDKQIATELVGALKANGFKIWYAPMSLSVGDKLLDGIEEGIKKSDSAILLISKDYLEKKWTNYEMDSFIRLNIEKDKKILPIWHNVEKQDVEKRFTALSGILALNTNMGVQYLVSNLTKKLSDFAPSVGVIPGYESPIFRFLQGRGEIHIGNDGPATTLWEFLIHSKDSDYPLFLDGISYSKKYLLLCAAELLPHIPDEVRNWVFEEGRQKIWSMCLEEELDPNDFA